MDLSIRRGQVLGVIGRNGAGKSTFFKTLMGLHAPLGGRLRAAATLRRAYVPQVSALDAVLPVRAREVVSWGRLSGWSFLRRSSAADRDAVERAIVDAEASAFADRPYAELSEGQKQRILLARLLAADAELLLLDEPTAAMDPVAERHTYARLGRLAHEHGKAVVVIAHAVGVVARAADELLWLDRDGGHVVHGPPADVLGNDAFCALFGEVHVDARGPGHA